MNLSKILLVIIGSGAFAAIVSFLLNYFFLNKQNLRYKNEMSRFEIFTKKQHEVYMELFNLERIHEGNIGYFFDIFRKDPISYEAIQKAKNSNIEMNNYLLAYDIYISDAVHNIITEIWKNSNGLLSVIDVIKGLEERKDYKEIKSLTENLKVLMRKEMKG